MSYQLKVIKDYPIGFWPLDESSGTTASDSSGCGNNGTYNGGLQNGILPIVSGGISGNLINNTKYISLPITKDYYGQTAIGGLGTEETSDNDFTIELWIAHTITTISRTTLFADDTAGVGLYYEAGALVFKLNSQELYYFLNQNNKAMHIVATYSNTSMSLYVDGKVVATQSLTNFKFSNTSLTLQIGPTEDAADSFIVDAPAIYRYAMQPAMIYQHFVFGTSGSIPLQIVATDGGKLFGMNEERMNILFSHILKPEDYKRFTTDDAYYNEKGGFMTFYKTETAESKSLIINDVINIPTELNVVSSKIEWKADKNISVEVSPDGQTYTSCVNGSWIPGYNKEELITPGTLYYRITMTTSDASKYLPKLSQFKVKLFGDRDLYADNGGIRITSDDEYSLGTFNYPVLLRHKTAGLKTSGTSGFKVPVIEPVSSIEMFFSPSSLGNTTLVNAASTGVYAAADYSWAGGTISKTNIEKIYVNGVDKTTNTTISSLLSLNNLAHIVIVFTAPISGDIKFNYNSGSGPANTYNNLAVYNTQLTEAQILDHYNAYIGRPSRIIEDLSFAVTESAVTYYDNDWQIVQSI